MSQQDKKHTFLILAVGILLLALVLWLTIFYWPGFKKESSQDKAEQTPQNCNYQSHEEIYSAAKDNRQPRICLCLENYEEQQKCLQNTFDVGFYQEALKNLDINICDKIVSDTIKNACQSVVSEGLKEKNNE